MATIETQKRPGTLGPLQLPLPLSQPPPRRSEPAIDGPLPHAERVALLDQRMTTAEVLRVVGVHRATLFRWTRKGTFPPKHHSGGWLRSDVEHWLSHRSPGAHSVHLGFSTTDGTVIHRCGPAESSERRLTTPLGTSELLQSGRSQTKKRTSTAGQNSATSVTGGDRVAAPTSAPGAGLQG